VGQLKQDLPDAKGLDTRRAKDPAPRTGQRGWGLEVGGLLGAITVSGAVFLGAQLTGGGGQHSTAQVGGPAQAGSPPPALSTAVPPPSQPAPPANAGTSPNSALPPPSLPGQQLPVPADHQGADGNPTTHVVRDGDTMWETTGLALGPLSSPAKIATTWRAIWDANRSTIGSNPNLLQAGQVLVIPALL